MPTKNQRVIRTAKEALDTVRDSYFELTKVRIEVPEAVYNDLRSTFAKDPPLETEAESSIREENIRRLGMAGVHFMNVVGQSKINGRYAYFETSKKLERFLEKCIDTGDVRVDQATAYTFSIALKMALNVLLVAHAESKLRLINPQKSDLVESIDYWFDHQTEKFEQVGLFDFLPRRMVGDQRALFEEVVKSGFDMTSFVKLRDEVLIATLLLFTAHVQKTQTRPDSRLKLSLTVIWSVQLARALARSDIELSTALTDPAKILEKMPNIIDARSEPMIESILADPTDLN